MRVVMTGAGGFVGSTLKSALIQAGHEVTPLSRRDYQLEANELAKKLDGSDLVINLAGANIAQRWSEAYKAELISSRVDVTQALVAAFGQCQKPPKTLISTSAVGRLDSSALHDESATSYADNFLGQLTAKWEAAALEAKSVGTQVLIFRFGVVVGPGGGMLQKMMLPFKLGLGGKLGDGTQGLSWIHIDDLISAYLFAIDKPLGEGVYHLCAPHPTTNTELTSTLARTLNRPAFMSVPAFMVKLLFGEGAQVMLEGQQVISTRLLEAGFVFRFQTIQEAIDATVNFTK